MAVSIHLIWLIDEKESNFRMAVWFKPPIPPIKADIRINIMNRLLKLTKYEMIIIGANFCHVIKIKQFIQEMFSITLGNQKWKGAAPNFSINVV